MIWVTGDCHGKFERFKLKYYPEQAEMAKEDIMIICGDFGGVWFGDSRDDDDLDWLERLPFTLAFVDGNHENYDAITAYPVEEWHGGKIHRIRPHVLHLMRGQIFELEGCRFFTMGGARSHDIEDGILELDDPDFERKFLMLRRKTRARFRINHISWWEQELPSDEEYAEARRNLGRCGWQADYIITHCAPISTAMMESRHNEADELTEFFQEVKEKAEYCTGAHKTVWRKSCWLNTSRTPEESAAGRKILCKRFSTKSRMALESRADSGLNPLITESHGG